jgi:peptidoglycan hydrolase-like protein with peptidoglycan-binding domain
LSIFFIDAKIGHMKRKNLIYIITIAAAAIALFIILHYRTKPATEPTNTDTGVNGSSSTIPSVTKSDNMPILQSGKEIATGQIAEGPIAEGGLGSSGVMVPALQIALRGDGYYKGPIDAKYTKEVVAAVSAYQKDHGLKMTGSVDAATIASLEKTHPKK